MHVTPNSNYTTNKLISTLFVFNNQIFCNYTFNLVRTIDFANDMIYTVLS